MTSTDMALDPTSFAAALKMHRDRPSLTQAEAATLLAVSKRVVENWERQEGGTPLEVTVEGVLARLKFAKVKHKK